MGGRVRKSFSQIVDRIMSAPLREVAPPGFEGTVKAMKKHKDIKNPYAMAWAMKKKGDKSHYKANGTHKKERLDEKWSKESTTDPRKKGMWDGWTVERLRKEKTRLKNKKDHRAADTKRLREVEYAIRAKTGWKKTTESRSIIGKVVEHPRLGMGQIVHLRENDVGVRFKRMDVRIRGPRRFTFDEAHKYLTPVRDNLNESWLAPIGGFGLIEDEREDDRKGNRKSDRRRSDEFTDWKDDGKKGRREQTVPLSVEGGEEDAEDTGPHVRDDMEVPDDAPEVPKARDLKTNRQNVRSSREKEMSEKAMFAKYKKMVEGFEECEGKPMMDREGTLDEHNMAAGEIAVTQDLMVAVLKAVCQDQPDEDKLGLIALALAKAVPEDRTLTIDDIDAVNSKIKELVDQGSEDGSDEDENFGQDDASDDDEFDDQPEGDGEIAGAEGGDEHEGKTKLMRSEGEVEDEDPEMCRSKVKESRRRRGKKLDEAWLAPIGGTREVVEEIDESDPNAELKLIRRRAGIANWWKV